MAIPVPDGRRLVRAYPLPASRFQISVSALRQPLNFEIESHGLARVCNLPPFNYPKRTFPHINRLVQRTGLSNTDFIKALVNMQQYRHNSDVVSRPVTIATTVSRIQRRAFYCQVYGVLFIRNEIKLSTF